jgi:vitamin B12 transporter
LPTSRAVFSLFILVVTLSATDLKVHVADAQSAAIPGAQIALLPEQGDTPYAVKTTPADGIAIFRDVPEGAFRVRIYAAGFAMRDQLVRVPNESSITVTMAVSGPEQTVVVTATRTPVVLEDSGAKVTVLDSNNLTAMQPMAASDALRFLPGAVVNSAGRRGGLGSLFVRGGDSRYNKVIVDDVTVNDPGGTFDFGVVPLTESDRVEFARGAQSTLYGSDAMTSVVQVWTRTGSTHTPELRFGAEGGTFRTARGYASIAGARGILDYNLFGEQTHTDGQGPNDDYSNSSQGGNIGVTLHPRAFLRIRARHSNSFSGVQSFWNFDGQPLLTPDLDQRARQNNFLASADLIITGPSRWQHTLRGFEYNHHRSNIDDAVQPGRSSPLFGNIDFPFSTLTNINRSGVEYQGEYWSRSWARTTIGYQFEDENGFVGDRLLPTHGLRLNHAAYAQEIVTPGRVSFVGGARFVHNGSFGNKVVPRIAASLLALRGNGFLSGTRLRFAYATGIKEPRLEESFANDPFTIPNPNLKAEENRSLEAGVQQNLFGGKYSISATYFNNQFRNQIDFATDPTTFIGQYVNLDRSISHGAEFEFHARPLKRLAVDGAYNYTSTQILQAPVAFDPLLEAGRPLLRRPKHSGSLLATYFAHRWGGSFGGSFVGRRPDSDFLGFGINHAAGYARLDSGLWFAVHSRITAYINGENLLNRHYEEVAGYPALRANFRAGLRFRIGGE